MKFWINVPSEIKDRGVKDTYFLVGDGLKGLPEVADIVWVRTTVQICIIHLIRHSFRLVSKKGEAGRKRELKSIYVAPNHIAAKAAMEDLDEWWGQTLGGLDPPGRGRAR